MINIHVTIELYVYKSILLNKPFLDLELQQNCDF